MKGDIFVRVVAFLLIAGLMVGGVLFAMISVVASYTSPYAISIAPWLLFIVLVIGVMFLVTLVLLFAPRLFKGLKIGK